MIVIFEGLDGCGKTTLAKLFAEKTGYKYIHESYTDDCEEKEKRLFEFEGKLIREENVIFDRSTLIDDFVYGFLNKKQSSLIEKRQFIISLLKQCKIFHLRLDEELRKERFEKRGDEFVTNDMMNRIRGEYLRFYEYLPNVEYIDLSNDNEENIDKILRRLV